jgi:hypothetical protein
MLAEINPCPPLAALLSSDSPDWCTPPEVLDPVRAFAAIRFDPFSNAGSIVGAQESICLPSDSLLLDWPLDGLIWCNPPYGRELARCAAKIAEQARRGAELITLVPARTDTRWWKVLAPRVWCAWRGRITFLEQDAAWRARVATALLRRGRECDPVQLQPRRRVSESLVANESAPFPAALCYHGWRPDAFAKHFAEFGEIYAAPVAAIRRPCGRPKAELPPPASVLAHLAAGKSIRRIAAELRVPKNRIESVRKLVRFRTQPVLSGVPAAPTVLASCSGGQE